VCACGYGCVWFKPTGRLGTIALLARLQDPQVSKPRVTFWRYRLLCARDGKYHVEDNKRSIIFNPEDHRWRECPTCKRGAAPPVHREGVTVVLRTAAPAAHDCTQVVPSQPGGGAGGRFTQPDPRHRYTAVRPLPRSGCWVVWTEQPILLGFDSGSDHASRRFLLTPAGKVMESVVG
jgi:hypothetical protein